MLIKLITLCSYKSSYTKISASLVHDFARILRGYIIMVLITRKISFNRFGIGDWFWSHPCPCPSCFWFSQGDASNYISSWHCQVVISQSLDKSLKVMQRLKTLKNDLDVGRAPKTDQNHYYGLYYRF